MPHALVNPVLDTSVRGLCSRPYEGHPRGCPNFGCKKRCPPMAPTLYEVFGYAQPFYAIWSTFDLGGHVRAMAVRHPEWSQKQIYCVRYWQGTARARLRKEVLAFRQAHPDKNWTVEETPEAMGVDVTATMKTAGVALIWPPGDTVYHVALAGIALTPVELLSKG